MKIDQLQKKMLLMPPPTQPCFMQYGDNYMKSRVKFNPTCVKDQAVFIQFTSNVKTDEEILLLPDACLKFIFEISSSGITPHVIGLNSAPSKFLVKPGTLYFCCMPYLPIFFKGKRFNAKDIIDKELPTDEIFKDNIFTEIFAKSTTFKSRIDRFCDYALKNLIDFDYNPNLVEYMALLICSYGGKRMPDFEKETSYSDRYCRKLFSMEYGMSLKRYCRVLRFQHVVNMILANENYSALDIVCSNEYYDQSHYIHDFRTMSTFTPDSFKQLLVKEINVSVKKSTHC